MSRYESITIDGKDGWGEFGFFVLKNGFNDWLSFPDTKAPFSHDWGDEDGIEVDLNNVFVKEKNVSLQILFVSDSREQFWKNYESLKAILLFPGTRLIYIKEIGRLFEVYYVKCSGISKFTRLRQVNKIAVGMTLNFIMPNPVLEVFRSLLFGYENEMITGNGNNLLIAI